MTPAEKIQAFEETHLPDALYLLKRFTMALAKLYADGQPVPEKWQESMEDFIDAVGATLVEKARKVATDGR